MWRCDPRIPDGVRLRFESHVRAVPERGATTTAWALTNTASLNSASPFGSWLGEPEEQVATNDDRMDQVVFAAGQLWGGVNTVIGTSNGKGTWVGHVAP